MIECPAHLHPMLFHFPMALFLTTTDFVCLRANKGGRMFYEHGVGVE